MNDYVVLLDNFYQDEYEDSKYKFNELCVLIDTISKKTEFQIIYLQETWMPEDTDIGSLIYIYWKTINQFSTENCFVKMEGDHIYAHPSNICIATAHLECLPIVFLSRLNYSYHKQ